MQTHTSYRMRKILGASLLLSGASSALALPQLETDAIPASPSSLLPAEDILDTIYPVATPYQTCTIDTATGRHNCRGDIQVVPMADSDRPQARVKVNLDGQGIWRSVTLRYRTCKADGWTWHIGDSPTNNGYAGDGGSTQHDAEAQSLNRKLMVYASDIGGSGLTCQFPGPPTVPEGCVVQQVTVSEDNLRFNPAVYDGAPVSQCSSPYLFDFPNYDEYDAEDPWGQYENWLYFGLNRTYGSAARNGVGITRACIFASASTLPADSLIERACRF
jgi:hypothetical protein